MGLIKRFQRAASAPTTSAPSVPPGTVIWQAGNTAPSGYLKANGATISRTVYANLFATIGTIYGVGDGTTTFKIPDLRGEFVRGWDDSRGVDSGRVLGSAQGDAIRNLTGTATLNAVSSFAGQTIGVLASVPTGHTYAYLNGTYYGANVNIDASRQVPTAHENRPRSVALLACIKF